MAKERLVFDTNALVSRLLLPASVPARAVRKGIAEGLPLASEATLMELAEIVSRPKFDPYVTIAERQEFLRLFARVADRIEIIHTVRACRDPTDDKFLELAVNGAADIVVTGDKDLLALNPFRGVPILTPAVYLARSTSSDVEPP